MDKWPNLGLICGAPTVRQIADFVSDFDRPSFRTLRPASHTTSFPRVHSIVEVLNFRTGVVRNDACQTLQGIDSPPQTTS